MKFFIALTFVVLSGSLACAELQLPVLKAVNNNDDLHLTGMSINVTVEGILAETVIELEYYNEGHRNLEGEFTLKLPEGATVSTYALEVNGEMRPGVAVEKAQARFAYESIKRRRIDPGLVEREEGNIYRTKIFPIVRRQTKKVRIGFIHPIENGNYRFPLNGNTLLKKFTCSIDGKLTEPPGLVLSGEPKSPGNNFGKSAWSFRDVTANGMLTCQAAVPQGNNYQTRFDFDEQGNLYFVTQGQALQREPRSLSSFRLIWDTSHSGNWRNHKEEFDALKKIATTESTCHISVHFLGESLGPEKKFTIRNGNIDELVKYLKTPVYHGYADFSKIPPVSRMTLLFSDGNAPLKHWALPAQPQGTLYIMHSHGAKASPWVVGQAVDIIPIGEANWWQKLRFSRTGILRSSITDELADYSVVGDRFVLSGKIPRNRLSNTRIQFRNGGRVDLPRTPSKENVNNWNLSRRIWAGRQLARIEKINNAEKTREFAIQERLTSDYTSLIVLERFQDHLTYNIPPPEPDLLARYEREKAKSKNNTKTNLVTKWKKKIEWHNHEYTWFDGALIDETRKVQIFARSSRVAFSEKTINRKAIRKFEAWHSRALETTAKRKEIEDGITFKNWLKEVDQRIEELQKIRDSVPVKDAQNKIHFSVRGNVKERGIYSKKPPFTLQDAIRHVGGTNDASARERVFLYRNADRTGYNLNNRALDPIELQWGDMIVAEAPNYQWNAVDPFFADPFASGGSAPVRRSAPAVFEAPGSFSSAKSNNWSSDERETKTNRILPVANDLRFQNRTTDILAKYSEQSDLWPFYIEDLKLNGGLTASDTIKIARLFFAKSDTKNGSKVLSNLFDVIENPVEAIRSYAYWIAQFGSTFEAVKTLQSALDLPELDHRTRALLHFDIGQLSDNADSFRKAAETDFSSPTPSELGTVALTDAYVRSQLPVKLIPPYKMTSDYRIVITSMGQFYKMDVQVPKRFNKLVSADSFRQVSVAGVTEHQRRKALPGKVNIGLISTDPGTYHVRIYRKFGDSEQKLIKQKTVYIDTEYRTQVGELNFDWNDIPVDEVFLKVEDDPFADPIAEIPWKTAIRNHCLDCHDADSEKGGLNLDDILDRDIAFHSDTWEKVVRQLEARQMPPVGKGSPSETEYQDTVSALVSKLDLLPVNPGRTDTLRRLNRTEYQNAIRDLLGLEIDASELLPPDESSHGFDNITVGDLSPALLDRYLSAARKISRLAVGKKLSSPDARTIRIAPDLTQEEHVEGLPLGTRGGTQVKHIFPRSGEYEVRVRLTRDRNELIEGLHGPHEMVFLLNDSRKATLKIAPPEKRKRDHTNFDANLKARFFVPAGSQSLGVTFIKQSPAVQETLRQPYEAQFNYHRHPRPSPALYQITIVGPFDDKGPAVAETKAADIAKLIRKAWRRPATQQEVDKIMKFYKEGGMEMALSAILVSRDFLFRVEKDPEKLAPETVYSINDLELASRMSFFLWSSLPDEALLTAAEKNLLISKSEIKNQALRMLDDPRSESLVYNFANQWLYLRNLDSITPDGRLFPDFDHNLRQAFKRETELLFSDIIRNDRSVLDLLRTKETWLNERLAKHYGIPHVYGSRFRKVQLKPEIPRGGLLRHGSILTVTSYATRTSPVIRGNWILENFLGTPPPPPPPDVPALDENSVSANLPIRERLAAHREKAACASCHNLMDPVGFSLENFDAVGRWRTTENGVPVDAEGGLPGGRKFTGVEGLEKGLLERPDLFVRTLTEKLMTFALGRGIEPSDAPAIRQIVRDAKANNYRFSSIISGIVTSPPFTMRTSGKL